RCRCSRSASSNDVRGSSSSWRGWPLTVSAIRETATAVGFVDVSIANYLQLPIERDGEVMFSPRWRRSQRRADEPARPQVRVIDRVGFPPNDIRLLGFRPRHTLLP